MELLAAEMTDQGTAKVTFAHDGGVDQLEGSPDQIAQLGQAMKNVSVLAGAGTGEESWLYDVRVGDRLVQLGLRPDGRIRLGFSPAAD